jgi:hypothetical protein
MAIRSGKSVASCLGICLLLCSLHSAAAQEFASLIQADAVVPVTAPFDAPGQPVPQPMPSGFPGVNCPAPCCDAGPQLELKFIPYFILTRMVGDVTIRGVNAPVDVTMGEMWDLFTHDLNFAFVGQLEAKYGRLGFLANGVYMDMTPHGEVRNLRFNAPFSQTVLDLAFSYELGSKADCQCLVRRLELVAGVRYNSLTADVTVTGPLGNTASLSGARNWTDPIVGLRAEIPLSRCWTLLWRGDVGGFGINGCSQFTWNIEAALAYHCSDRCSLFAGYRWLDIDYARGEFAYDMQIDGPMVGLIFRF